MYEENHMKKRWAIGSSRWRTAQNRTQKHWANNNGTFSEALTEIEDGET